jgi:type III pantothenate kinase
MSFAGCAPMTMPTRPDAKKEIDYLIMNNGLNIIALNIGNTRTQIGLFENGKLTVTERWSHADAPKLIERIVELWRGLADLPNASIVMASVDAAAAERIAGGIEDQLSVEVYAIGDDLPVPIGQQLDPETITGVDRLLNAAAAYDVLGQACVIIDAGTAVTVDFVDGDGTFHGGAIAPGARMQLKALHEQTTALPEIDFRAPDPGEAFGRNTAQAMLQGVTHSIRGLAWRLTEQYAERYGAFPTVIATGGDAEVIFAGDQLIDRIVPELTLLGIAASVRHAMRNDVDV